MLQPRITPKPNQILPILNLEFEHEFYSGQRLPISFEGTVSVAGKVVGRLSNWKMHREIPLELEQERHFRRTHHIFCDLDLSRESVLFIQDTRDKEAIKDVRFNLAIIIRHLKIQGNQTAIIQEDANSECIVPSSDWVTTFCPALGVGHFSTLEFEHSSILNASTDAAGSTFAKDLRSAHEAFVKGDWIHVLTIARKVFERGRKLKPQIEEYSKREVGSAEYGQSVFDLFNASFQFLSKYQHTHSRKDEEMSLQISKSDAESALYLMMSITAWLQKLDQHDQ